MVLLVWLYHPDVFLWELVCNQLQELWSCIDLCSSVQRIMVNQWLVLPMVGPRVASHQRLKIASDAVKRVNFLCIFWGQIVAEVSSPPAQIRRCKRVFFPSLLNDCMMVLEHVPYIVATLCPSAPEQDPSIWWRVNDIVINSRCCIAVFLIIQCTNSRKNFKGCKSFTHPEGTWTYSRTHEEFLQAPE